MMLVVCHDAGGAEIISSYLQKNPSPCIYILEGPAVAIFKRKLAVKTTTNLHSAIQQSQILLCGTSWQSELELQAIELAHRHQKHSIAYLDHWANYKERFVRNENTILPHEIWVADDHAQQIAQQCFPDIPIFQKGNFYLEDIALTINHKKHLQANALKHMSSQQPSFRRDISERVEEVYTRYITDNESAYNAAEKSSAKSIHILYVCEPIQAHALKQHGDGHYWGYTEEDALKFFITNLPIFDNPIAEIVLRPHPSENIKKYSGIEAQFDLPLKISKNSLLEDIQRSDVVVGCESMAMVVALIAHKIVISVVPPGGKRCTLPHPKILHLNKMLERRTKVRL